jgi:hypothetical protein
MLLAASAATASQNHRARISRQNATAFQQMAPNYDAARVGAARRELL